MAADDFQHACCAVQLENERHVGDAANHLDRRHAAAGVAAEREHMVGAGALDKLVGAAELHLIDQDVVHCADIGIGADHILYGGERVPAGYGREGRAIALVL